MMLDALQLLERPLGREPVLDPLTREGSPRSGSEIGVTH